MQINRVVLIVLDGVGCGALPDADDYGDPGSNTLGNLSKAYPKLKLPNLERWGIGHLTPMKNVRAVDPTKLVGSAGRLRELSKGKDTTAGHWEMTGIIVKKAFKTYPSGFPQKAVDRWVKENSLPGILGNKTASGTEIITELGEEHIKTGKPIVYTSADSVWQIAAHEEHFGLEKLLKISKSARKICDELQVSRVIARPFVGSSAKTFKRTSNRKDYSQPPPEKTMMEHLIEAGGKTLGIGKIWNIFNGAGIQESIETKDNAEGMKALLKALSQFESGLLFVNLIDFDMLYGHRRDVQGFANAMEEFDKFIPSLEKALKPSDLVIITGDHGNDPTYKGTDHTREHVPLLVFGAKHRPCLLGDRASFSDIGQTTLHALTGRNNILKVGASLLPDIGL